MSNSTTGVRVFLSYARADDEPFVKRLYEDLISHGFIVWWDRVSMPNRGLPFSQEISNEIKKADRFILVVGEYALTSPYVCAEWEYALSICKPVNIALRKCDYQAFTNLSPRLAVFDALDFQDDANYMARLQALIRQLRDLPAPFGEVFGRPEMPPEFLPRPEDMAKLHELVITSIDTAQPSVLSAEKRTTALEGMGGIGKSVLATAFVDDCATRRAFPDGIIWLSVGQKPSLRALYQQLGAALGDNTLSNTIDENVYKARVQTILNDKQCLLVLDDVWDHAIGRAFRDLIAGMPTRLLITTRNLQISNDLRAKEHQLKLLNPEQSIQLLKNVIGYDAPGFAEVAKRLDYLPLALKLAGARIKNGGLTSTQYIEKFDLVSRMTTDGSLPNPKDSLEIRAKDSLEASIGLGVVAVFGETGNDKLLYYTFGIFPEDVHVPRNTILRLWKYLRPDVDEFDLDETLTKLVDLALVERHAEDNTISLHDLLHSYTREKLDNRYQKTQRDFLASYKKDSIGWRQVDDDGYLFQHLVFHLLEAGYYVDIKALGEQLDKIFSSALGSLMVNDLSRYYPQHKTGIDSILTNWLNTSTHDSIAPQIVASVAITREIEPILKKLLVYPNEKVQFFVVQDSYRLWQQNPELMKRLLTYLADQINLFNLPRTGRAVNTLLRCSLFIWLNDRVSSAPNPQTSTLLLNIWHPALTKFFLVNKIAPAEASLRWIRRRSIGIIITVLMASLRNMTDSTKQSIFSFHDVETFFPATQEAQIIIKKFLSRLDVAAVAATDSLEELVLFIKDIVYQGNNDPMTAYSALAALMPHVFKNPLETTIRMSNLLQEFDKLYPPMKDANNSTTTIWYEVIGLTFSNIPLKAIDRETAYKIIEMLLDSRFVFEQRYYTSFQFPSGKLFRGNSCVDALWGYEFKVRELGYEKMKRYLDLLMERNDFEQINNSIYALIEGIDYYSLPAAAFAALQDALRILHPYIDKLDNDVRQNFWGNFTNTLVKYGSRHKEYLDDFLKRHGDLLPKEVKLTLLETSPTEDFNRIFSVIILLFVRKVLENQDSPEREFVKWGFGQILEARSLHDLVVRWISRLINVIYGASIISEIY